MHGAENDGMTDPVCIAKFSPFQIMRIVGNIEFWRRAAIAEILDKERKDPGKK